MAVLLADRAAMSVIMARLDLTTSGISCASTHVFNGLPRKLLLTS